MGLNLFWLMFWSEYFGYSFCCAPIYPLHRRASILICSFFSFFRSVRFQPRITNDLCSGSIAYGHLPFEICSFACKSRPVIRKTNWSVMIRILCWSVCQTWLSYPEIANEYNVRLHEKRKHDVVYQSLSPAFSYCRQTCTHYLKHMLDAEEWQTLSYIFTMNL